MNEFLLLALGLVYLAICRPSLPWLNNIWQRYWHKRARTTRTDSD